MYSNQAAKSISLCKIVLPFYNNTVVDRCIAFSKCNSVASNEMYQQLCVAATVLSHCAHPMPFCNAFIYRSLPHVDQNVSNANIFHMRCGDVECERKIDETLRCWI